LKRQRPSWRRQREIQDSLSSSLETSNQLEATTAALKKARTRLDSARRNYLGAIDAELSAGTSPARLQQLQRVKGTLASQVKAAGAPRHIMIPDLSIDPLADPEELDQRAVELRESERQLSQQLAGLDAQAADLVRSAQLRKHNDRAVDLVARYEDAPHRRPASGTTSADQAADGPAPSRLPVSGSPGEVRLPAPESAGVSNDVIDTSIDRSIDALETRAAQRSGDPAQRAEAARKLHDALARRLEQVRRKRIEIEDRARMLRGKR
jgi:hypothetical protein